MGNQSEVGESEEHWKENIKMELFYFYKADKMKGMK